MDPVTGATIVGGVLASKDALLRVFGPTLDVIGGEMKNLVQRMNVNLSNVVNRADRKVPKQSGAMNLKLARDLIAEAKVSEDDVTSEYIAGLLASEKHEDDSRGVSYCSLIRQMSSIEIRLHYLIYYLIHTATRGLDKQLTQQDHRKSMGIVLTYSKIAEHFKEVSTHGIDFILPYAPAGLERNGLIDPLYRYGPVDYLKAGGYDSNEPGLVVFPSILGIELFLWAAGEGGLHPNKFLSNELKLEEKFPENLRFKTNVTLRKP